VNVAHAKNVCEAFTAAGIRSSAVWGEMPRDERRTTLERFSNGDLDVITNCNVLTEGFDEPRIAAIIMARPTKSKLLYAQMVGRGTRLHQGKEDLLVIDIADNSIEHHLPGLNDLFNLPAGMNLKGSNALSIEREIQHFIDYSPWIDISRIHSPAEVKLAAERIEFWNFDPPPELADFTPHVWHVIPGGYRLFLSGDESLLVEEDMLDAWNVRLKSSTEVNLIHRGDRRESAINFADDFVHSNRPDAERLVSRGAAWRGGAPTDKQIEILRRNRISAPQELTRGQAAQIIAYIIACSSRKSGKLGIAPDSADISL
jgi:hypothetical protein